MAEVDIRYDGSSIATMDASGTKTLLTAGKYCPASFQVEYNRPTIPDLPTDVPVFTVNRSADWSEYISPTTCNMTYAEVQAWVNQNYPSVQACAQVIHFDGTNYTIYPAVFSEASGSDLIFTVLEAPAKPILDLYYHSDPTLTHVITYARPSQYYSGYIEYSGNGLHTINKYVWQIGIYTDYIVGLEKDANDNYCFSATFAEITDAYNAGNIFSGIAIDTLPVTVTFWWYEVHSDPTQSLFHVSIIEEENDSIPIPDPVEGSVDVPFKRYTYRDLTLDATDTVTESITEVTYSIDSFDYGTEAQPSDVPAGLLFINSSGLQVGTAT